MLTGFMLATGSSMATIMAVLGTSLNGTRSSTVAKTLSSPIVVTASLPPTPLIKTLRAYCHDKSNLREAVRLTNGELIKLHNASSLKKERSKAVGELRPAKYLETLFTQLQQQKSYLEIDLVKTTQVCASLFLKIADVMPNVAEFTSERAKGWRGSCGFFITNAVLRELCAINSRAEHMT